MIWKFIDHDRAYNLITGTKIRSVLLQGGLEVPCTYTFTAKKKMIDKLIRMLIDLKFELRCLLRLSIYVHDIHLVLTIANYIRILYSNLRSVEELSESISNDGAEMEEADELSSLSDTSESLLSLSSLSNGSLSESPPSGSISSCPPKALDMPVTGNDFFTIAGLL